MKTRMSIRFAIAAAAASFIAGEAAAQSHLKPCPPVIPVVPDCPPASSAPGGSQALQPSLETSPSTTPPSATDRSLFFAGDQGGADLAYNRDPRSFGNFLGTGRAGVSSVKVPIYQRNSYLNLDVTPLGNTYQLLDSTNGTLVSKSYSPLPVDPGSIIALAKQQLGWVPAQPSGTIVKGNAILTFYDTLQEFGVADAFITEVAGFRTLSLSVPGDTGAGVGRFNISDNNSPIPRDRVFLNYNMYSNTVLGGTDIQKLTPGFEKTFFDGMTSIEVRAPFASTLASSQTSDFLTNSQATQFGNLAVAFKALVSTSEVLNVSLGFGVSLPTGQDAWVHQSDGTPMLQIKNSSVQMSPFIGILYTPNDRFFALGFSQLSFGLNGSDVSVNLEDNNTLSTIGKINDRTIWSSDLSLGYWVIQDSCGFVSGLAPMLEFHYNQSVGSADVLDTGNFRIGDISGSYNNVNVTIASIIEFRNNMSVTTGLVLPITGGNQREFDWEFGLLLNYRFGARTPANSVQTFGN